MLHGYAWRVEYPRRKEQGFITTDTDYLVRTLVADVRNLPGWKWKLTIVPFRGEGALPILTKVYELQERFPEGIWGRLDCDAGVLSYTGKQ